MTLREIPIGAIFAYQLKDGSYSERIYIKARYDTHLHQWECPRFGYAHCRLYLSGAREVKIAR